MSILRGCAICCMCISIWAIIQLTLMGAFYKIEVLALIEDVHAYPEEYEDFDGYIKKTHENYQGTARNCWIAAGIYCIMLLLSCLCLKLAKTKELNAAALLEDDEYSCTPPPPKKKKEHR